MTDEEINRAINESRGLAITTEPGGEIVVRKDGVEWFGELTNYCGDWNAIHEVELLLGDKWSAYADYVLKLQPNEPSLVRSLLFAPIEIKAEALARALAEFSPLNKSAIL